MPSLTGGSALYDGLEYQALVSALAAIEIVVLARQADTLELEPASDEDAEADIAAPLAEDEPCRIETGGAIDDGYRLVIQSKRRDTGDWSGANFTTLLGHGGDKRKSAESRLLADAKLRYLLATSGTLVRGADKLRTRAFLDWPLAADTGAAFSAYTDGADSRVAILGNLTEEQIRVRLFETLRVSLSVPHTRIDDCITALVREAMGRGSARHSGIWTRSEIETTLTAHEAVLPGTWRQDFVPPLEFDALQAKFEAERVILLAGPSGTGKTRVALRLRDEARRAHPGAKSIDINVADGPQALSRALEEAPAVIYIEDPWGPVALAPGAAAWTKALKDIVGKPRPNLWIVITSRSDILAAAHVADKDFAAWRVELEASNYGETEREALFDLHLPQLSPEAQRLAARVRPDVVEALATPLEIDRYFAQFRRGPLEDEHETAFLRRVLKDAGEDSYAAVVAEQVRERGDQFWAMVLWLLLKGDRSLSSPLLRAIRRGVTALAPTRPGALDPLVAFLEVGHSLEWSNERLGYAHPKVGAGLALVAADDAGLVEDTLHLLLEILTQPGTVADGVALAARILAAHLPSDEAAAEAMLTPLAKPIRDALDAHLADVLTSLSGRDFRDALFASGRIGSPTNTLFQLARWLTASNRPDRRSFGWMRTWTPPTQPQAWFEAIAGEPWTRSILENFIESVISYEHHLYSTDLVDELARFGFDLAPSYTRLAARIAGHGYDDTIAIAVTGGLIDLDGFVMAVEAAISGVDDSTPSPRDGWRLAVANGEYDEEPDDHLTDGPDDDGYCASEITCAFAKALRAERGWPALDSFKGVDRMLYAWVHALDFERASVGRDELLALYAHVRGGPTETHFWWLATENAEADLGDLAGQRLAEGVDDDLSRALHQALALHAPARLLTLQAADLATGRLDRVVIRLRHLTFGRYGVTDPTEAAAAARARLLLNLPAALASLAIAAAPPLKRALESGDALAAQGAAIVDTTEGELAGHLLRLTGVAHPRFDALYAVASDTWLPDAVEPPIVALEAAVRGQRTDLLQDALRHPLATVRKRALLALGDALTPDQTAALARDKSYFVRLALVGVIGARATSQDALLLTRLCRDRYYAAYSGRGEPHPVATAAARALSTFETLTDDVISRLYKLLGKLKDSATTRLVLAMIARHNLETRQGVLSWALTHPHAGSRRLSAIALLDTADRSTDAELDALTAEQLLAAPPAAAVALAQLVALRGDDRRVHALAERLGRSPANRALILLLLGPVPSAARRGALADQLPDGHAARTYLLAPSAARLAYAAIDDLGDAQRTGLVRDALGDAFEASTD